MSKEAMKLALEALNSFPRRHLTPLISNARTALREALAEQPTQLFSDRVVDMAELALADQPAPVQQEPVAWGIIASNTGRICQVELDADEVEGHNQKHIVPLYTSPPAQRKPLTDEQAYKAIKDWCGQTEDDDEPSALDIFRAAESAHGIKEQPAPVQQEPVAIADGTFNHNCPVGTPLYTSPPAQRTPLTDEQIDVIRQKTPPSAGVDFDVRCRDFARAIEAKLRSKNEDRN